MKDNTPAHLLKVLGESADDGPPDDERGLPPQGGTAYQAHGRATIKPLYAIHFLRQNGGGRTFQYVDMHSRCAEDTDFDNSRFTLAFLGMRPVTVMVEGRNLLQLYDYIHQHRMPWVMEIAAGRDFVSDGTPVVTKVSVDEYHEPDAAHR
jgi:hypothetical protein